MPADSASMNELCRKLPSVKIRNRAVGIKAIHIAAVFGASSVRTTVQRIRWTCPDDSQVYPGVVGRVVLNPVGVADFSYTLARVSNSG